MRPSQAELDTLRDTHGSIDRVAQALGEPRDKVRAWYQSPHLRLVDDDGLSSEVHDNEIPVIVRDYSHLDSLRVYPLGDVHKGAATHQGERWREWLAYLSGRKDVSMLGTGDFLNAALKDSKSDVYEDVMTVGQAKRELRRELSTLAKSGRLDILLPGNHEARIHRAVGDCPIEDLADSLGCPYARSACLMVYKVGQVEYEIFVRHGTGNGQSLVTLAKGAAVIKADVYVTGHTHKQAVTVDEYFVRDGDRIRRQKRVFLSSGSYLGYEGYAAERGYVPTRIGAPRIHLDGHRHDVHVSV